MGESFWRSDIHKDVPHTAAFPPEASGHNLVADRCTFLTFCCVPTGGAGLGVQDGAIAGGPVRIRPVHRRRGMLPGVSTWGGSGEGVRRHADSLRAVFGQ